MTVVLLPFEGRLVAEARVEPPVVVAVDPGEDRSAGGGPVGEPVAVHELAEPADLAERRGNRLASADAQEEGEVALVNRLVSCVRGSPSIS